MKRILLMLCITSVAYPAYADTKCSNLENTYRMYAGNCARTPAMCRAAEKVKTQLEECKAQEAAQEKAKADKVKADEASEEAEKQHTQEEIKQTLLNFQNHDKHELSLMVSSSVCRFRGSQQTLRRAIADEYASAKNSGGGIIDQEAIYDWQEHIRRDHKNELDEIAFSKKHHLPIINCGDKDVKRLVQCLGDDSPDKSACTIAAWKDWSTWFDIIDWMIDNGY